VDARRLLKTNPGRVGVRLHIPINTLVNVSNSAVVNEGAVTLVLMFKCLHDVVKYYGEVG
jgi:hypothetical protein